MNTLKIKKYLKSHMVSRFCDSYGGLISKSGKVFEDLGIELIKNGDVKAIIEILVESKTIPTIMKRYFEKFQDISDNWVEEVQSVLEGNNTIITPDNHSEIAVQLDELDKLIEGTDDERIKAKFDILKRILGVE